MSSPAPPVLERTVADLAARLEALEHANIEEQLQEISGRVGVLEVRPEDWMLPNTAAINGAGGVTTNATTLAGEANVKNFGAVGNGIADDTKAIKAAVASVAAEGGRVVFPAGKYRVTETLVLPDNTLLVGIGPDQTYLGSKDQCRLEWAGAGEPMIEIACTVVVRRYATMIQTLTLNLKEGTAKAGTTGIYINGLAGSAALGVLGCTIADSAIEGFNTDVRGDGLIIGLTFRHTNISQPGAALSTASHLVNFEQTGIAGKIITQVLFDDCFFNHTANNKNTWAIFGTVKAGAEGSLGDVRIKDGTVTCGISLALGPEGNSGVYWPGASLVIVGTHFEGASKEQTNTAIRIGSTGGNTILPSEVITWGTGVEVGDPTRAAVAVTGTTIGGKVEGNTTDIRIAKGGVRLGTQLLCGSATKVTDERTAVDGVTEVSQRYLVQSASEAMTARAANAETLPPQVGGLFTPCIVKLTLVTKAEKTKIAFKVGGVIIARYEGATAGEQTVDLPVPAGKAWEVNVTEGALTSLFSTYIRTTV